MSNIGTYCKYRHQTNFLHFANLCPSKTTGPGRCRLEPVLWIKIIEFGSGSGSRVVLSTLKEKIQNNFREK